MTLTTDQDTIDAIAIAELRSLFCHLVDDQKWEEASNLYTEDARFKGSQRLWGGKR